MSYFAVASLHVHMYMVFNFQENKEIICRLQASDITGQQCAGPKFTFPEFTKISMLDNNLVQQVHKNVT